MGLGQPCSYGCSSVKDTGASIAAGLTRIHVYIEDALLELLWYMAQSKTVIYHVPQAPSVGHVSAMGHSLTLSVMTLRSLATF